MSHCSPETLIAGMLLAAAIFPLHLNTVWFGFWYGFFVVVADLVCGSWGFLVLVWFFVFCIGTAFDWRFKLLCQQIPKLVPVLGSSAMSFLCF